MNTDFKHLKQPTVAWSLRTPKKFHFAFLIYAAHKYPHFSINDMVEWFRDHIERSLSQSSTVFLVQDASNYGWINAVVVGKSKAITVTQEGLNHVKSVRYELQEILDRSFDVIEEWERDLYSAGVQPVTSDGLDVFDGKGLRDLHRTLLLHIVSSHRENILEYDEGGDLVIDTGQLRTLYLFEIFRYMEHRYGWRASDSLLSELKGEQMKEKHLSRELLMMPVPVEKNKKREGTYLLSPVELLLITNSGRARLEDGYRTTYAVLQKTKKVLHNWKKLVKEL